MFLGDTTRYEESQLLGITVSIPTMIPTLMVLPDLT
jgi:hypothetical protein